MAPKCGLPKRQAARLRHAAIPPSAANNRSLQHENILAMYTLRRVRCRWRVATGKAADDNVHAVQPRSQVTLQSLTSS
jgi:hypothetical protein